MKVDFRAIALSIGLLLTAFFQSKAYIVSNLATEYHNGQIFLTWTNPSQTNLQYNVYRSLVPITLSSQLNSSAYLGFVRDSSGKNVFWSQQSKSNVYFKITNSSQPLSPSKGLYVVTCTGTLLYYYAVTVTNLSSGNEDKTIAIGNTTLLPALDIVAKPQPVFQDSITAVNGEVKVLYTMYVNNQETALWPAMNSTGSYGFNFFTVKRGSATRYPLFVLFEGFGNKDDESINLDDTYGNCYAIGVFDWLPLPNDKGDIGDNNFFCCYHENFNIYSNTGVIPTTGIVKTYSQKLYWEEIKWLESQVPIDTTRLYCKGTSANGYGAVLTAALASEKIAAVYGIVEPNSTAASTDVYKQMWGSGSSHLKTDVIKWNTTDTLKFTDMKDIQKMVHYNELRSVPVIYDVHGKNDETVIWNSGKITWFDSLQSNHIGGAWYWDQRTHGAGGANFVSTETEPNYYRFATNISYPCFSNCTINQNPGNGAPTNGDDYGAINGYLDWNDSNVSDKACNYTIHVFVKDFYVGGVLDPEQYSTCKADVTFRRLQNFHPADGNVIKWTNFDDVTNAKIQNGTLTYHGGLITIIGLTINKTGNKIKLAIKNCGQRDGDLDEDEIATSSLYFSKSPDGYNAHLDVQQSEHAEVFIYDLMGRTIWQKQIELNAGTNTIEIPSPSTGIFLVQVKGESFSKAEKLLF